MGTGMTNSIPDYREREWDVVIPGNDREREREWLQKIGSNFIVCRKNKRRCSYHIFSQAYHCIANVKTTQHTTQICSNISLTKEMPRITQKIKTGHFLDMSTLWYVMNVAIGWVALPIVVVHRNVKSFCQSYQGSLGVCVALSFVNHHVATFQGCHIGYSKLNDVQILKCEWI